MREIREISNADLTVADLPGPNADYAAINVFALTFNGYHQWGSFRRCAEIANRQLHGSLDELRTCLFFEQRRWRHFGDVPDGEAMSYLHEVVEKIRDLLIAGKNH